MTAASRSRRVARPRISSFQVLHDAALRFRPHYEVADRSEARLRVLLRDPEGRRPDIVVRHRHDRRLFFRANYLVVESEVPGDGPSADGELRFRFRGPFSRQRAKLAWRAPVAGGETWPARLQDPLLQAIRSIQAIESLLIRWRARTRTWHLELTTLSGSMVGGFMTAMPIAVPLDRSEVTGIIGLVDALAATTS